jgi:L-alanine-DL-glutamate epimerase-like enolase superfamily enzyme
MTRADGYTAAKFGWGPFGLGPLAADADQLAAAREGLGEECVLLIDAGTVWGEDVERAATRLDALAAAGTLFLEEPFISGAHSAYRQLRALSGAVALAGGEGAHNYHLALHMMDNADIDYVQIDTGRIGGITPAKRVADAAVERGVTYLNHTFTSHLALSASLAPFAGVAAAELCEYPVAVKPVSWELTREHLARGDDGLIRLPEAPGLGISIDEEAIARYLVDVDIRVGGRVLYRTPQLAADVTG